MLFSIIIPIYNIQDYILKTLDSVSNQKQKNYEVLLIDDGSTDNTSTICKEYSKGKANWHYFKKPNGGLSDARNFGLKKALGEYIIFLDGDDEIVENTTEYFEEIVNKHRNIDVFSGLAERIENDKSTHFSVSLDEGVYSGIDYFNYEMDKGTLNMAVWLRIYSRSFLMENNFKFKFRRLHEDEEFTPRVLLNANSICVTKFVFYRYLIREGSISQKKDKTNNGYDIIQTMIELDEYVKKIPNKETRKLMDNYIVFQCLNGFQMIKEEERYFKLWDDKFLSNRYKKPKNKFKYYIFKFNRKLYYKIYYLFRKEY